MDNTRINDIVARHQRRTRRSLLGALFVVAAFAIGIGAGRSSSHDEASTYHIRVARIAATNAG
jgi:hypothetical protein